MFLLKSDIKTVCSNRLWWQGVVCDSSAGKGGTGVSGAVPGEAGWDSCQPSPNYTSPILRSGTLGLMCVWR